MAHHKLVLDDDFDEEFSLIAIHCSESEHKIAFMINKYLSLQLKRKKHDLDFCVEGNNISYPIFEYEDDFNYTIYHLVANKCKYLEPVKSIKNGLFEHIVSEKTVNSYLLNDYKNVDYFMKISSDFEKIHLRNMISTINEIEQVISAYIVDSEQIKSKNHLIFD